MRMARKNLYIPEEHEITIERLEKALERRGQSLSDFFMQSVKDAVPTARRGQIQGAAIMRIPTGVTCALAVDAVWRHSGAVNALVGPPDQPGARSSDSSLIFAKVLGSNDPFGLWIELNTESKRFPHLPVLQLTIPWRFVLAICVDPRELPNAHPDKRYGFPDSKVDVTTVVAEALSMEA